MTIGGALAGGFAGTVVLTTILRAGSEARLTRLNLPFLLGTALTPECRRPRSTVTWPISSSAWSSLCSITSSSWPSGAAVGAGSTLRRCPWSVLRHRAVNILLPAVHPRMGTPFSAADSAPLIEPPGFLMRNYGRPRAGSLAAHVAYGTIVGGFVGLSQ